jgi:hypothetical protein
LEFSSSSYEFANLNSKIKTEKHLEKKRKEKSTWANSPSSAQIDATQRAHTSGLDSPATGARERGPAGPAGESPRRAAFL